MTLIRKLASVACLALLSLSYSVCNAQDYSTGNLINFGTSPTSTTSTWQNAGQIGGSLTCWAPGGPGYCGPQPYVGANGEGTINFSYGYTDLYQNINVANAISIAAGASGSGLQVKGFDFSFMAKNGNGWDNGQQDYLKAYVNLYGSGGSLLAAYDYSSSTNQKYNWTQFNFSETFANPYTTATLSTARVGFIGYDTNGWAGPYGPELYNINFSLRYGYDPCATNPAYGPQCAGFDKIVESANLVPNPGAYAYGGYGIDNSYAINTALKAAGTGISIHGFKWGYVANANGPYCNSWDMGLMGCWDFRIPSATTYVNITDSAGKSLYSVERTYQNSYNTTSYSYLFPQSQPVTSLGTFQFTGYTNDQAYIGSMWSKAIYTPDKCTIDPTSSPTCPNYFTALGINTSGTTSTTTTVSEPITTTTTTTVTDPVSITSVASTTSVITNPTAPTATLDPAASPTTTSSSSGSSVTTASSTPTPSATNPQPKIGEVATSGSQPKAVSSVSTSQILSIVSNEQSRISKLETSTSQSASAAAQAAGEQATAESQAVASTSIAQSNTLLSLGIGPRATSLSSVALLSAGVGLRGPESAVGQTFQTFTVRKENTEDRPASLENKDPSGNPINNLLNQSTTIAPTVQQSSTGQSVKQNVKDNDAAGGVNISAIAKQPIGFELYMAGMQDRPFYAPKEIYKGQKVVDNARAQRMLNGASDRLHQQMVDQQYNLGQ